jgi:hypothetical protein
MQNLDYWHINGVSDASLTLDTIETIALAGIIFEWISLYQSGMIPPIEDESHRKVLEDIFGKIDKIAEEVVVPYHVSPDIGDIGDIGDEEIIIDAPGIL